MGLFEYDKHRHHRRHRRRRRIVLFINGVGVTLTPNQETRIMVDVTVGHSIALSIQYLDQKGNPMLTPAPKTDSPPAWTNSTPATETLTVAADGNTATATTVAVGTDIVSLALAIGGVSFSASLSVNVTDVPQILTSIAIASVVS